MYISYTTQITDILTDKNILWHIEKCEW
jgi:hypothetical protein